MRRFYRRLKTMGVSSKDARFCAHNVGLLLRKQGTAGTIRYLKACGSLIQAYVTGVTEERDWVSTKDRYPKALTPIRNYSVEIQLRVAKAARMLKFDKLRKEQVKKVRNAALNPPEKPAQAYIDVSREFLLKGIHPNAWMMLRSGETSVMEPLVNPRYPDVCRMFARVKASNEVKPDSKSFTHPNVVESMYRLQNSPTFLQLPRCYDVFRSIHNSGLFKIERWITGTDYKPVNPDCVGEIHATQEGGGKLRMFAAPYTVFQELLTPLHVWLDKFRGLYLSDCTYDQSRGAEWARSMLAKGYTVASVDLSTATCRFPLSVQISLLVMLGCPKEWVDALLTVCTGKWSVSNELRKGFKQDYLWWSKGQPLGIRPSMSLFSLTHNVLLRGLCIKQGLDPENSFRVLGDDVVMLEDLYKDYIALMDSLDVPISWNKTHVSRNIAEFAGYTITPTLMFRPGQWKPAGRLNHLSLSKEFGPLVHELPQDKVVYEKIHLFKSGEYNPPVERWSWFIKANSILFECGLQLNVPTELLDFDIGLLRSLRHQGVEALTPNDIVSTSHVSLLGESIRDTGDPMLDEWWSTFVWESSTVETIDGWTDRCSLWWRLESQTHYALALGMLSYQMAKQIIDTANVALWYGVFAPPRKVNPERLALGVQMRTEKMLRAQGMYLLQAK